MNMDMKYSEMKYKCLFPQTSISILYLSFQLSQFLDFGPFFAVTNPHSLVF